MYKRQAESVLLNDIPEVNADWKLSEEKAAYWANIMAFRGVVNLALEKARAAKVCKKSTDAKVTLYLDEKAQAVYETIKDADLEQLFIVSKVDVSTEAAPADAVTGEAVEGLAVTVAVNEDPKCPRCAAVVKAMHLDV